MQDERYACLGRAIYRAMGADPKSPDFGGKCFQGPINECLPILRHFLTQRMVEAKTRIENCTPDIQDARDQVVQELKDEIRWVEEAAVWFGLSVKERNITNLDNEDIKKAEAKK